MRRLWRRFKFETIDAAPIVCCGDCAKWTEQRRSRNSDLRLCEDFRVYMSKDAGCAFFERRTP